MLYVILLMCAYTWYSKPTLCKIPKLEDKCVPLFTQNGEHAY